MEINLRDFLKKSMEKKLDFSFEAEYPESLKEEVEFLEPVSVLGDLRVKGDKVSLVANVKSKVKRPCTRCLDPVVETIDLSVQEAWAEEVPEDDPDTIPISEGETIDLSILLVQDIISSLPIQSLCSQDCQGLCQECGANLNRETCDCDKEQVDPRFAALKDLFKEV